MSTIFLKDVAFSVAATDYKAQLSSVKFTPSVSSQTWTGFGVGNSLTDVTPATWACELEFGQDWTEDGFSRYLYENEGETVSATFTAATGLEFEADVVVTPGTIGGGVGAYATATVSLPVKGRPEVPAH